MMKWYARAIVFYVNIYINQTNSLIGTILHSIFTGNSKTG